MPPTSKALGLIGFQILSMGEVPPETPGAFEGSPSFRLPLLRVYGQLLLLLQPVCTRSAPHLQQHLPFLILPYFAHLQDQGSMPFVWPRPELTLKKVKDSDLAKVRFHLNLLWPSGFFPP